MLTRTSKARRTAAGRGAELRESQVALLSRLATELNAARRGRVAPDEAEALRLVEDIVTLPTTEPAPDAEAVYGRRMSPAAVRFNEVAAGVRVVMQIEQHIRPGAGGQLVSPSLQPVSAEHKDLAKWLWIVSEAFFWREGWRLLKRCAQCERWFVDRTKNMAQARCSMRCTRAWWNTERRRAAGHRRFNRRAKTPTRGK